MSQAQDAAVVSDAAVSDAPIISIIARENMLPGDDTSGLEPAVVPVEGYASAVSAAPGETVQLSVNTDREREVRYDLYRVGDYQGMGARRIASGGPVTISVQPACPVDAATGRVECDWGTGFELTIDPSWVSGYYFVQLLTDEGPGGRIPLIVREGVRRAPGLVQASVTTWEAYNPWGGTSIYNNLHPAGSRYTDSRGHEASFDRPYEMQNGLTPFLAAIRWIERRGYDVSYTTNVDIDADPTALDGRVLFVSVAHDEYWSVPERTAVDQARDRGVSLAFLSGNTSYWRIRLEPSYKGVPRRTLTCYKSKSHDPVQNAAETTSTFRGAPAAHPENALLGVMYATWSDFPGFPFAVVNPNHWIYEGTSVKLHDTLSNVVGSEWDHVVDNGASPAGLEIVGETPTIDAAGSASAPANATLYYPTRESLVFAAGSITWGFGLGDDPDFADARVQRMTDNVFMRAGLSPMTPPEDLPPSPAFLAPVKATRVLAGTGEAGSADGPAASATFGGLTGLAAAPDGSLYILDAENALVRKLSADGMVSSLSAASADLALPLGIAVDAQGQIYISNSGKNRIERISADGATASTYAGSGGSGASDASDPLQATFSGPRGLALGKKGELYVADTLNDAIRRIDASGVATVATGVSRVSALAVSEDGTLYFTSLGSGRVGLVNAAGVQVLADADGFPGNLEGPAAGARLRPAEGLIAERGRLVFSDTGNHRVRTCSLGAAPTVSTLFGDGRMPADAMDSARVVLPRGLAPFQGGYAVADFGNRVLWFSESSPSPCQTARHALGPGPSHCP